MRSLFAGRKGCAPWIGHIVPSWHHSMCVPCRVQAIGRAVLMARRCCIRRPRPPPRLSAPPLRPEGGGNRRGTLHGGHPDWHRGLCHGTRQHSRSHPPPGDRPGSLFCLGRPGRCTHRWTNGCHRRAAASVADHSASQYNPPRLAGPPNGCCSGHVGRAGQRPLRPHAPFCPALPASSFFVGA